MVGCPVQHQQLHDGGLNKSHMDRIAVWLVHFNKVALLVEPPVIVRLKVDAYVERIVRAAFPALVFFMAGANVAQREVA